MRSAIVVLATITVLFSYPGTGHAQCDCYYDTGNMCSSSSCHVFAQDQYDTALPDGTGNFSDARWIFVQCTSTCTTYMFGIDYSQQSGDCYDNCVEDAPANVATLKKIARGAPVYTMTCSGALIAVDQLPPRTKPTSTNVWNAKLAADSAAGGVR